MTTLTPERLALLQTHLALGNDTTQDAYLAHLLGAADAWCLAYVRGDIPVNDPTVEHAALLLASHWYANREAVGAGGERLSPIPFGVEALLDPIREQNFEAVTGYVPD